MLYICKLMTYHSGEHKRKEKFLYNDADSITPPSTPTTPRGSSPPRSRTCVCFGWTCW